MLSKTSKIASIAAIAVIAVAAAGWYMTSNKARESSRPKKIGIIQLTSAIDAFPDGMKEGMKEFGYVEGDNIIYEYESIEQDVNAAAVVTQRYIDDNVDVIFAITNPVLGTALEVTKKDGKPVPIVFVGVDKPVETGLIKSFSSSGNNSTGIMGSVTENVPKQIALLREMLPKAKTIGIFGDGFVIAEGIGGLSRAELYKVAPQYGFTVKEYKSSIVSTEPEKLTKEFDRIAAGIKRGDVDAVFHLAGHWNPDQQFQEIALAQRIGAVNVMPTVEEVSDGGTYGYAPDLFAVGKDTAVIIDKILRGARPEDVPVEYPRHNLLWVNLDAAKKSGITIPDSILTKADKRLGETQ